MGLQTEREVVKACFVADFAFDDATRQVVDLVGKLLPYTVEELVGRSVAGSLNWVVLDDEGVELDHLVMVMKHGHRHFSSDLGRESGYVRKERALGHSDRWL